MARKKKEKEQHVEPKDALALQLEAEDAEEEQAIHDIIGDVRSFTDEQLILTEEELNFEMTTVLKADNPYVSEDCVEFSFKDMVYKLLPRASDTITLFSMKGNLVHKFIKPETDSLELALAESRRREQELKPKEPLRRNKFNFADNATQTPDPRPKEVDVETQPPPTMKFGFNATLWDIGQSYEDMAFEYEPEVVDHPEEHTDESQQQAEDHGHKVCHKTLGETETVMFRMLDQNLFNDVILDYSYYDNPCDEFLEHGVGSVLPLWKFSYHEMKSCTVTDISWNRHYIDLFAVAYGTNSFLKSNKKGSVCIFSLKCTSHPERMYKFEHVVQSVSFHKEYPYLLAAGFATGRVGVFDLRSSADSPIATSDNFEIFHNDEVTKVVWLQDDLHEHHNFCSVGADGRVIKWTLAMQELIPYKILQLRSDTNNILGLEGTPLQATSAATSASFNDDSTKLYLVASEIGRIYKCSDQYNQQYLHVYKEHTSLVYHVEWNPYHKRVFLTCSADWTVRVWDCDEKHSSFNFDMLTQVLWASWAPFSSTVFAAITQDGKVHVFDLVMNRMHPTCSYQVYSQKKHIMLSTVSINPRLPILLVGDEKGHVLSFKMSPNIRSSLIHINEMEPEAFAAAEVERMENVLKTAKSPELHHFDEASKTDHH